MLSKSFIALIFFLTSISSVNAHAGVTPALGVKGQFTRNDVQRPSAKSPCGNINISQNLDASTTVQADANGNFSPSITDFNGGADGSRSIQKVEVDATGTGTNFVPAKMVVNGDANPTDVATQKLTVQLPAGTKCTGGTNKNLCLASFTTTAGFGNCAVVSQGAGTPNASASASTSGQSNVPRNGAAKGVTRSADSGAANDEQTNLDKKGAKSETGKKAKGKKAKAKDGQNGKGKGAAAKDANRIADSGSANGDQANPDKKGKGKGKGNKKNKGKGKQGKQANKGQGKEAGKGQSGAQNNAATANGNNKRSWSSRPMGNFA